jgi:hypothetical protein
MRFVLCIVFAALLPASAVAAKSASMNKGASMSIERAQAAAAKGDQDAAAAVGTTTDKQTCLNACSDRGYSKHDCDYGCRPGLCHTGGDQPYCVSK